MRRVPCGARSRVFATLAAALGGAVCGCGREGDREGAREGATPFRHVVLEGTALEMGRAQGRLLREAIRARVAEPIDPAVAASLALFAPPMRDLLPPAFAEELAGIAEGAGVDVDALFLREIVRDGRRWHDLPTPLVRAAFASAPGTAPCVVVAFDGLTAFAGAGAGAGRLVL